ncbi:hypothetical protein LshimejAT787_1000710 [Lyophyllum shimeji]|uniref:Uncharacterized protein n=1 Tax=Lyophyllum shimeji TaxID=47721 RepID=A0A9P3USR8_LYOSH|nr:hypothetical protein LshimejAT787_1000710 [Lyophyllum shimeji]
MPPVYAVKMFTIMLSITVAAIVDANLLLVEMFARLVSIALLALPALAARGIRPEECTASLQCCDTIKSSGDTEVIIALASLGIPRPQPDVPFGLNCTPQGYPGIGGDPCPSNKVGACCVDNDYPGNLHGRCLQVDFDQSRYPTVLYRKYVYKLNMRYFPMDCKSEVAKGAGKRASSINPFNYTVSIIIYMRGKSALISFRPTHMKLYLCPIKRLKAPTGPLSTTVRRKCNVTELTQDTTMTMFLIGFWLPRYVNVRLRAPKSPDFLPPSTVMTVSGPFLASKTLQLAAVLAESFLVGSYFIVVILISWVLVAKDSPVPRTHRLLFGGSIFMFLVSVVHLGLVMQELTVAVIPKANGQAQVVLATIQYATGDLILIWRVWVVWGFNYWIAFTPLGLLLAAAGLSLHQLAGQDIFFSIIPVSLIVANTSLCTALIFGRVWYIERKAAKTSTTKCTTGIWKGSMILFIESGVLYTSTQLLSLILSYKKVVALPLLLNLEMPLIGILPSLIIIVVHYDLRRGPQTQTLSRTARSSLISGAGRQMQAVSDYPPPQAHTGDIWLAHKGSREENVWRV